MKSKFPRIGATLPVLIVVLLAVIVWGCRAKEQAGGKYHCPMHPTYISDRIGDCPICGMRLVPIETKTLAPSQPLYECPMHPEVTSDEPGRCPKCGMNLVPVEGQKPAISSQAVVAQEKKERKILFYRHPMNPSVTSQVPAKDEMGMDFVAVYAEEGPAVGGTLEGLAPITISEQGMRLAGVQTAEATRGYLTFDVRTIGIVAVDETRVRHVHTKIEGWIEKLFVNFTGQRVHQGDQVLSIYSPKLLSSQEEYLRARESSARLENSKIPEVRKGAEDLVKAARQRLE